MIRVKFAQKLAISALFLMFFVKTQAQYMEAGIFVGGANYRGDLADKYHPDEWNTSYGLSLRYFYSPKIVWKTGFVNGQITGNDLHFRSDDPRHDRNLSFRTQLIELSTQVEYSLLKYDVLDGKVSTPYVFAGIGATYFNPQAEFRGAWYDLRPLGTEGQGWMPGKKKYSSVAMVLPLGLGFRFALGRRVNLGFELGYRYSFSDHLDDVSGNYGDVMALSEQDYTAARLSYRTPELYNQSLSQPTTTKRGDASKKDSYMFAGLCINFNLTDQYGLEWNKKYRIHDAEIAKQKAKKGRKWWQPKKKNFITQPPMPNTRTIEPKK